MPTLNNTNLTSITHFNNFKSMVLVFKIIMVDFSYTIFFLKLLVIVLQFYFLFKTESMVKIQLYYWKTKTQQILNKIHVFSSNLHTFLFT